MTGASRDVLRVMVVEPSSVARQAIAAALRVDGVSVRCVSSAAVLFQGIERFAPHVVTLESDLPDTDGLDVLRRLVREYGVPVVVLTADANSQRLMTIGARAALAKPPDIESPGFAAELLEETLRAAGRGRVERRRPSSRPRVARPVPRGQARSRVTRRGAPLGRVICVGASTGGPEAIQQVLSAIPSPLPAMLITQHMGSPYTAAFAARLDNATSFEVLEAKAGMEVQRGRVIIAPGHAHMRVRRHGHGYVVDLIDEDLGRFTPSIDCLLLSAAAVLGRNAVGLILTGMQRDGSLGLKAMHDADAFTVVQDEATSTVFSMPRAAIELGAVDLVLPLREIGAALMGGARLEPAAGL